MHFDFASNYDKEVRFLKVYVSIQLTHNMEITVRVLLILRCYRKSAITLVKWITFPKAISSSVIFLIAEKDYVSWMKKFENLCLRVCYPVSWSESPSKLYCTFSVTRFIFLFYLYYLCIYRKSN